LHEVEQTLRDPVRQQVPPLGIGIRLPHAERGGYAVTGELAPPMNSTTGRRNRAAGTLGGDQQVHIGDLSGRGPSSRSESRCGNAAYRSHDV
jgi:hypothetical protein